MSTWQIVILIGISFVGGGCLVGWLADTEIKTLSRLVKSLNRELQGDTHRG